MLTVFALLCSLSDPTYCREVFVAEMPSTHRNAKLCRRNGSSAVAEWFKGRPNWRRPTSVEHWAPKHFRCTIGANSVERESA